LRYKAATMGFLVMGLLLIPAMAEGTLLIFGNANMDESIDDEDISFLSEIISGEREPTDLADADHDGKIDEGDVLRVEEIIAGVEEEITLLDGAEGEITIQVPVERIVPLNMRHACSLVVLGAEEKIVGVDQTVVERERLFPRLCNLPSVGAVREPDAEAIISLQPDLILTFTNMPLPGELEDKMPAGISVLRFDLSRTESIEMEMKALGYLMGDREEAARYLDWYAGYMREVEERASQITDRERVFLEREKKAAGESTVRWAYADQTGYTDLCAAAGGLNIADGYIDCNGDVEAEWVLSQNPDVIIGLSYNGGYMVDDPAPLQAYRQEILSIPGIQNVTAAREGRVYIISGDFSIGPQILIGSATVAKWLYPDVFEDLDVDAIHEEFLRDFMRIEFDPREEGAFVYPG